jgi:hypothetical protein
MNVALGNGWLWWLHASVAMPQFMGCGQETTHQATCRDQCCVGINAVA